MDFNPRSLTGATHTGILIVALVDGISIHAPSRERLLTGVSIKHLADFNPRSLTGAT